MNINRKFEFKNIAPHTSELNLFENNLQYNVAKILMDESGMKIVSRVYWIYMNTLNSLKSFIFYRSKIYDII